MKLTANEAFSKRCPLADRAKTADGKVTNRFCLADECMAWRWAEPAPIQIKMEHKSNCSRQQISILCNSEECIICGAKAVQIEMPEKRLGYCGLAGVTLF
jgi:hypothetical protein